MKSRIRTKAKCGCAAALLPGLPACVRGGFGVNCLRCTGIRGGCASMSAAQARATPLTARILRKTALLLALSMAGAGIALASNTSWFVVDTAYGTNGVSEALASTSYGMANAVDHNDVNHYVYSLVAAHPSDFNGYVGPFTLTRRLSSGAIDTAFGASGVTTSFANYNDSRYTFHGLCIDPVTHGLVLVGAIDDGGAIVERLMPPDANGVAALDTSLNGEPPGVVTWVTSRPSHNVRPRGCTVLGDRSIFVAGPDGLTPTNLAMGMVSVGGELPFPFAGRGGVPTPSGDNWEGGSIEWNSSQAINPNLIIMGSVAHNAMVYAVDPCTGDHDMNFNGNGFLSVPAIDGHTYSDPVVGAVQGDGSVLLALLASDTLNADLVGWSYPVMPDSWQTPTTPGVLTVPGGIVLGGGSSPAPVRQADGTILIGAETTTNQQVLFALQGDAALGFTVAAPWGFCGTSAGVYVPDVVNDTQDGATVTLRRMGLTLGTVTQQSSSTVTSGLVISESPAANTRVTSGTAVSLVVSTGSNSATESSGGAGNGGGGSLDWLLVGTLLGACTWLAVTRGQKTQARLPQDPRADVRSGIADAGFKCGPRRPISCGSRPVATILSRTSMQHRNKVLLTATMAFCAIAMSPMAARPAYAQASAYTASPAATIYVDCAATSRGNGSARRPYWRITDALDSARLLRREGLRRIVIRVAAGICTGNFETQPTGQKTRPPELLPLVLNVPNLTLHGAGIMEYSEGYPSAQRPGTTTTVTVDTLHYGWFDNTVIYVGPTTDGGRADGTVVEGLAIDDAFNSVHGIWITRTQRITIRDNVVEHVNFAAMNVTDSSGSIVGNVFHDGTPGLTVAGGSQSSPSKLYVGRNSATANYEGIAVLGNSTLTSPYFEMGANPLRMLPYPINPTASQMGNRIDVEIEGNDVSSNYHGLNLAIIGDGHYPYSQTGYINASVHDNRFMDNAGFPFSLEEGFVFRATSSYWTNPDLEDFPEGYLGFSLAAFVTHGPFDGPYSGTVNARFEGNLWGNSNVPPIAPAILTFSSRYVYNPATGAPDPGLILHYTYMHNSRLNLEDEDGFFSLPGVIRDDLRPFDPLDGTALENRTRITR